MLGLGLFLGYIPESTNVYYLSKLSKKKEKMFTKLKIY
jgi:hypothetical protein